MYVCTYHNLSPQVGLLGMPRKLRNTFFRSQEYLCLGTIGLIVAPWKFDVLKTSIFALEASLLGQIFAFKNIKFPRGTISR